MVPDRIVAAETDNLPGGTALDLGCGIGTNTLYLAGRGWSVTGVDWSEHAVFLAERAAWSAGTGARFEIGDAATWGSTHTFDLVVSTFALPTDGKAAQVIRNLRRLVAPGGTLLVAEWDRSMAQPWGFSPCELHHPETISGMLTDLEVQISEVRRIADMFPPQDPRAAHGSWANVALVKARKPA